MDEEYEEEYEPTYDTLDEYNEALDDEYRIENEWTEK